MKKIPESWPRHPSFRHFIPSGLPVFLSLTARAFGDLWPYSNARERTTTEWDYVVEGEREYSTYSCQLCITKGWLTDWLTDWMDLLWDIRRGPSTLIVCLVSIGRDGQMDGYERAWPQLKTHELVCFDCPLYCRYRMSDRQICFMISFLSQPFNSFRSNRWHRKKWKLFFFSFLVFNAAEGEKACSES